MAGRPGRELIEHITEIRPRVEPITNLRTGPGSARPALVSTGREGASPALVLRGSARLVAGLSTRRREVTAADLAGADPIEWKRLRAELEERRQRRVDRRRFRRDPEAYLKSLENDLYQSRLPP